MNHPLRKDTDMATASSADGSTSVPDWILRGVVAVVVAAMILWGGSTFADDHQRIRDVEAINKVQSEELSELKKQSEKTADTATDIALIKQRLSTIEANQSESLKILRNGGRYGK